MKTKERLLQLIEALGLSKSEFERVCGLSNGYINSIRNSLGSKGMNQILEKYPQVSKSWLMFGEGEMFETNPIPSEESEEPETEFSSSGNHITVKGSASNISNGTTEKTILIALTEVSEMRKLLNEVININKEQSQRLLAIVDKIADRI